MKILIKNPYLQLTKLSYSSMLLYSVFILPVLEVQISNMTLILGMLTVVFMVFDLSNTRFNIMKLLTIEVKVFILFILYCISATLVFASYKSNSISSIFQLLLNIILMIVTIYIILRDKNIKFCVITVVLIMSCMSCYAIFNSTDSSVRLALTESSNSNEFAHNALCGLLLIPLLYKRKSRMSNMVLVIISLVLIVSIVFSGSRMTLICLILYTFCFFGKILPNMISYESKSNKKIMTLLIMVIVVFIIVNYIPVLRNTLIYERMISLIDVFKTQEGDGVGRWILYEKAWEFFKINPLFGIGYGNYAAYYYGIYSHSTYAEMLSCTGILGTLILSSLCIVLHKEYKKILRFDNINILESNVMYSIMIVLFVLSIGEILMYKIIYFIIIGILIGYRVNYQNVKGDKVG